MHWTSEKNGVEDCHKIGGQGRADHLRIHRPRFAASEDRSERRISTWLVRCRLWTFETPFENFQHSFSLTRSYLSVLANPECDIKANHLHGYLRFITAWVPTIGLWHINRTLSWRLFFFFFYFLSEVLKFTKHFDFCIVADDENPRMRGQTSINDDWVLPWRAESTRVPRIGEFSKDSRILVAI